MTAFRKIEPDAETLAAEARFMACLDERRTRLTEDLELSILNALELNIGRVTRKTPVRFKITDDNGEIIFSILRFEATLHD